MYLAKHYYHSLIGIAIFRLIIHKGTLHAFKWYTILFLYLIRTNLDFNIEYIIVQLFSASTNWRLMD